MILPSPFNTHSHIHTQSLVYILREYLQEREETVIQWFREERASRGNHNRVEDGGKESGDEESDGESDGGRERVVVRRVVVARKNGIHVKRI